MGSVEFNYELGYRTSKGWGNPLIMMWLLFFGLADQEMDGMAIVQIFATVSGPDCLKDVVPKAGARVKVYNAIKTYLERSLRNEVRRGCLYHWN